LKVRIIKDTDFRVIKPITLNRQKRVDADGYIYFSGTTIGYLVVFKPTGEIFYTTYREPIHFFRKTQSFGISKNLLEKWLEYEENARMIDDDFVFKIIFKYFGKRERRYYTATAREIKKYNDERGYVKDRGNIIEDYGNQYFFPLKKMKILGYDKDDYKVKQARNHQQTV